MTKNRIVLLDFIRGILIVWVAFDHFFYDFAFVFDNFKSSALKSLCSFSFNYYHSLYREIVHPIVLFLFFFMSGITGSFSRNRIRRAVKFAIFAVGLFLVTFAFSKITNNQCTITFGLFYTFTVCAFVEILLDKIKISNWLIFTLGIILSTLGLLFIFGVFKAKSWAFFVVFSDYGFELSADYFCIIPYLGYFLIGSFVGKIFYKEKKSHIMLSPTVNKVLMPVAFVGRVSIWVYFITQVVFIAFGGLLVLIGV